MNTAVIKIEAECAGIAFPQGERCCCFGRVGEAVQLGELQGAVDVLDVAEDAAGADRGELLIITNQSDTRTAVDGEPDGGVEGQGVGHAGLVDDDQRRRSDRGHPIRQPAMVEGPGQFGQSVGADAGLLTEDGGCGSGRGEADAPGRRLRSRPGLGRAWPWSSLRRRGRSRAAAAHQRCTSAGQGTLAPYPGRCRSPPSLATPGPPPSDRADAPSRRPAAATRRCSASRIRCEVYRSAPATV